MAGDWYSDARRSVLDCLSSVLSIDDGLTSTSDPQGTTAEQRFRLAYYTEAELLKLAQRIRKLAASADWAEIECTSAAAAESAREAARAAYDERMAAADGETEGTA